MYKRMLDNCEPGDLAQLHDILTMMAETIDQQQAEIEALKCNSEIDTLKRQMKRVNDAYPVSSEVA